jgi:hypothetical protein
MLELIQYQLMTQMHTIELANGGDATLLQLGETVGIFNNYHQFGTGSRKSAELYSFLQNLCSLFPESN